MYYERPAFDVAASDSGFFIGSEKIKMLNSQELLEKLTEKTRQITGRKYVSAGHIAFEIAQKTRKTISASAIARLADINRVPYKSSSEIYAEFLEIPVETIKQKQASFSPRRSAKEMNKEPMLINSLPVFFWRGIPLKELGL